MPICFKDIKTKYKMYDNFKKICSIVRKGNNCIETIKC